MIIARTALVVFLGLCVACLIHALYFYPQLPDVVASHFGAYGKPDAWSSRNVFVGIYLVCVMMNALIFLSIAYGLRSVPDNLLNLPNKDFWLSGERRADTFRFFFHYFLWFGSATFLLLLDVFHQTFMVHTARVATLEHPWLSIGLYIGFSVIWSVGFFVRFARKKEVSQAE